MNFKKKLRTRLYIAISYIVLGIALIATALITKMENEYFSPLGFAFTVIGIARVKQYFLISKNEETIKKQEIRETDERNISISNKAKSVSFSLYILVSCIAVIVLQILGKGDLAKILGLSVCALLIFYWVSYFIIRKKS